MNQRIRFKNLSDKVFVTLRSSTIERDCGICSSVSSSRSALVEEGLATEEEKAPLN